MNSLTLLRSASRITVPLSSTLIVEPLTVTSSKFHWPMGLRYPFCGGDHAVGRAVSLARVERLGVLRMPVIQNLQLAHAVVGGIAVAGIADRQAVVTAGRKLELDSGHEVGQFLVKIDRAPLMLLAAQDAVLDLVSFDRAGPVGEVLAVENRVKTFGAVIGQDLVGLVGVGSREWRCCARGSRDRASGAGSGRGPGSAARDSSSFRGSHG